MSTLASLRIKLAHKKANPISAVSILKVLIEHGWNLVNNGKVLYLPLGDDDDFDWQEDEINESVFLNIVYQKEKANEVIGVGMTWKDTSIGGTVLICSALDISFSLTINRKRLINNITDVNWYLEKIIPCLDTDFTTVENYNFSQD